MNTNKKKIFFIKNYKYIYVYILIVVMYYYYARTSVIKKRVWWKQYLTTMQIVQFIIDIIIIYAVLIANNLYKLFPNFILSFPCAGKCLYTYISLNIIKWLLHLK